MLEAFFFIGLPYLALFTLVAGTLYRYRTQRFSFSAMGSQFLESDQLRWGNMAWHVGILIILVGHVIPFLMPGIWQALTTIPVFLIGVEVIGVVAAFMALIGLTVLLVRRVASAKVSAVTSTADFVLLILIILQILVGIAVATGYRWGASWSTSTTTPYLWSLLTLQPRVDYIAGLPPTVKLHLVLAWLIFMIVPFTRLVHMFSLPIAYLWRAPQKVVWTTLRPLQGATETARKVYDSRRHFVRGAAGVTVASGLLAAGVLDKLVRFFRMPPMTPEQEAELQRKRLERLEMAARERELEIERLTEDYIFVAQLAELSERDGRYFTDYLMRPALAFKDDNGLPLLISAKCTHLGCTVASTVQNGQILCPCHMSWFDVKTGKPVRDAVTNVPLPRIGWVLFDLDGQMAASQAPDGEVIGEIDPAQAGSYGVYIARKFEERS